MNALTLTVVHTIDPEVLNILSSLLPGNKKATEPLPPAAPAPVAPPPQAAMPIAVAHDAPVAPPPMPQGSPMPQPAPAVPETPAANPAPVPTAAPIYTIEQICQAAALFADTGDAARAAVLGLLPKYGAAMLTEIPPQRYSEFAFDLRQLGAKI